MRCLVSQPVFYGNILKFGTLLCFCSQIKKKVGYQEMLAIITNRGDPDQTHLKLVNAVCLTLFGMQLVFIILEDENTLIYQAS